MLKDRIKKTRLNMGLSQKELAAKMHIGKTTISNYETGYSEPDTETLIALSKIFGVSVNYLLGTDDFPNSTEEKFTVPVYSAVSCGNPFIADEDIVDYEEIDPKLKGQGDHFGLKLRGESMEPNFKEGDVVIVRKQSDVDSGTIAIVRVNGDEATMKIVEKSPDGITLIAFNPNVFLPKFYSNEQIKDLPVEIIGKVIEQRRKF